MKICGNDHLGEMRFVEVQWNEDIVVFDVNKWFLQANKSVEPDLASKTQEFASVVEEIDRFQNLEKQEVTMWAVEN